MADPLIAEVQRSSWVTPALHLVITAGCIVLAVFNWRLQRMVSVLARQAREHREDHERLNATLAGGRARQPPANISWHCPACGVKGIGHIPEGVDMVFSCPNCGVQPEITREVRTDSVN